MRYGFAIGVLAWVTGCAGSGAVAASPPATPRADAQSVDVVKSGGPAQASEESSSAPAPSQSERSTVAGGPWIGAAAESDVLLAGTTETEIGLWVDAPSERAATHVPVDVALVIDTSGSMSGAKIEGARAAAKALVEGLSDGDVVSVVTFSDNASHLIEPVALSAENRPRVMSALERIAASGGTNLYAGLAFGQTNAMAAPETHAVRRLVLLSDGLATVGLTSPAMLGTVAERGLAAHVQITSMGIGVDYDERTLDALAMRTSGRPYHLGDPRTTEKALADELALLTETVASDAVVDVVPAPGVRLVAVEGVRFDWSSDGAIRIPLGALHGGQHREGLVRARVDPRTFATGGTHTLASVRLRFHDPSDGGVERIQEVLARAGVSSDAHEVASKANARTQAIASLQEASKMELAASQSASQGELHAAATQLAQAETAVRARAHATKDAGQKKRLEDVAGALAASRASAGAAAAAPKAVQRDEALKMNNEAMKALGL